MNYDILDNQIRISGLGSFDLSQTLECGQCFRFTKTNNNTYTIIAYGRVLNISQEGNSCLLYPCTQDDFETIWMDYFDLNTDYESIREQLASTDSVLKQAATYAPGIRILNQEPWECLISFIISQNKNIAGIQKIIKVISERYGSKISRDNYGFPTPEQLGKATREELRACKTGFRDKYIIAATQMILSGQVPLKELKDMETNKARQLLMTIPGVGQKVSDCVLLYSLRHKDVFPTDLWIRRIVQEQYFENKDTSVKEIHQLAWNKFGNNSGIAQQYLFHYARNSNKRSL